MKAKDLRNSILQLAVQGKLVPQDPDDEPASVLLERIRAERAKLIKEKKMKAPKGGESVIYRASDGSHYEKHGKGEPVCIDDEIPLEIPESWEWVRLGSVAEVQLGKMLDKQKNQGCPKPYLGNINVQWDEFNLAEVKTMLYTEEELDKFRLLPGDLMVCEGGVPGRCAIWTSNEEMYYQKAIHRVRCIPDVLEVGYCRLVLQYIVRSHLLDSEFTGTTIKHLPARVLEQWKIPLPPMHEQKRIVQAFGEIELVIEQYGALEDAREHLDAELPDRLRKSILQLAVQGKLVDQDSADEPASVLLGRIRAERAALMKAKKLKAPKGGESIIYRASDGGYYEKRGKVEAVCIDDEIPFEIPENWAWARIRDFGFFSSGKTPSKYDRSLYDGDHLWVTSKDMKSFKIAQTGITLSDKGAAGLNTYPVGTMLFVVRSGILKRFLPIALLDKPATINQDIKALTLYYPPIAVGLAYFIKAFEPYILEDLTKSVTTVDSLRFEEFQNMLIPIPPEAEWNRIVVHLDIALGDVITNQ